MSSFEPGNIRKPHARPTRESDYESLLMKSEKLEGAMGAIAFAVLEMFKRGGMSEHEVAGIHEKMKEYFMVPTNEECNAICRMVETRLRSDKRSEDGVWYRTPPPLDA